LEKPANVATDGISNSVAIGANCNGASSNTIQLDQMSGSHAAITDVKTSGVITAASFKVAGGTATQFLKADGWFQRKLLWKLLTEFRLQLRLKLHLLLQTKC
jgi:hypothetical protein